MVEKQRAGVLDLVRSPSGESVSRSLLPGTAPLSPSLGRREPGLTCNTCWEIETESQTTIHRDRNEHVSVIFIYHYWDYYFEHFSIISRERRCIPTPALERRASVLSLCSVRLFCEFPRLRRGGFLANRAAAVCRVPHLKQHQSIRYGIRYLPCQPTEYS